MVDFTIRENPHPPVQHQKQAGHHWLEGFNSDNQSLGLYVLQWNPESKKWSRSGESASGRFVDTTVPVGLWKYISHCPEPTASLKSFNGTYSKDDINCKEPVPPGYQSRLAGHHWLLVRDGHGRHFDIVIMQWNPSAQKWSHSGYYGTMIYVDTTWWQYLEECKLPEME